MAAEQQRFVASVARGLERLRPSGRLLVAVSGGADSVALLEALHRARRRRAFEALTLVVGHVDHGLRPESPREAALVARHASRLGLELCVSVVEVGQGGNLEERARDARYAALRVMAVESGCIAIVTGHTATDQAETLLWRLTRGSGLRGLSAMRADRPLGELRLLRPMLALVREETRAFCVDAGLEFADDPSNLDERPRARLRADVLPVLERLAPGAVLRLAETARLLADDEQLIRETLPLVEAEPALDRLAGLPDPVLRRILVNWFERGAGSGRTVERIHLEALVQVVRTGQGEVELPAERNRRRVGMVRDGRLVLDERPRHRRLD
jgi:tRNA(Ile)-lysidine synthase